jgi:hypothetical protein
MVVRDLGSPLAQPPGLFLGTPRTRTGPLVIPPLPREFDGVVDLIGGPQVTGDRGADAAQAEELLLLRRVVLRASDHVSVVVGVHRGRSRPLHEFNLPGGQRAPCGLH